MKLLPDAFMLRIFNYLGTQVGSEYRRVILSLLEQNPDAKLLDLGCGNGEFALKVAERIGTREIYGIDIVEENIVKAKAKGIEVYQGDLNDRLPFETESFDVVHANQIIEHLCDTDTFIKEIHRVLRVGGYAIISTPNLASFHSVLFLLFGKQPFPATVRDEVYAGIYSPGAKRINAEMPAHRRIFTLGALKELLEYYGFKVEKTIGSGFYPLPAPLAKAICFIDKRHAVHITVKARRNRQS